MMKLVIAVVLGIFLVEKAYSKSWICRGKLIPSLELRLNTKADSLLLELKESEKLLKKIEVTKFAGDKKSGGNETQIHLSEGNPLRGGVRVRLVQENKDFPNKKGQGHITFRYGKKMRNDTIFCPDIDQITDYVRKKPKT